MPFPIIGFGLGLGRPRVFPVLASVGLNCMRAVALMVLAVFVAV